MVYKDPIFYEQENIIMRCIFSKPTKSNYFCFQIKYVFIDKDFSSSDLSKNIKIYIFTLAFFQQ